MHRKVGILFLFLFSACLVYGQTQTSDLSKIEDIIKNQLPSSDLKKLKALEKEQKEAMQLMSEVDKSYEEISKLSQEIDSLKDKKKREKLLKKSSQIEKKAIRDHVEALKLLSDIYVRKYEIYRKDIKKYLSKSTDADSLNEIKELEQKALNCYEQADLYAQKVFYTVNPNELFKIYTDAYNLEQLGILYKEKMYAELLNSDEKIKENIDEKIKAILANKPDEKDQTISTKIEIKDSINYTNVIVYDTIRIEQPSDNLVLYKIQIAASKVPLSVDKLKKIYSEDHLIQYELDNGWYKYSIGFFSYYQDAQEFKTRIGVPGAFIIAYKNGKKVSIKELTNDPSYLKRS